MIFKVNGGFANTNRDFLVKWGMCEEKTHDFCLNGGFEKTHDFRVKWGILEKRKCLVFWLNGGFAKRKRVIFA